MTAVTYASTAWMDQASCAGIPDFTEAEFVDQRRICSICPVQAECAEFGLHDPAARSGKAANYGGLQKKELRRQARARRIGREPRRVVCEWCSRAFDTTSSKARYCGDICRNSASQRRKAGERS